jgi:hypothetical protein
VCVNESRERERGPALPYIVWWARLHVRGRGASCPGVDIPERRSGALHVSCLKLPGGCARSSIMPSLIYQASGAAWHGLGPVRYPLGRTWLGVVVVRWPWPVRAIHAVPLGEVNARRRGRPGGGVVEVRKPLLGLSSAWRAR